MARRKFELALADLRRCLGRKKDGEHDDSYYHAGSQMRSFVGELARDPEKIRDLLGVMQEVRQDTGPGRINGERASFDALVLAADTAAAALLEGECSAATDAERQVLRELAGYALDCLKFKRARDSFGGERRRFAYETWAPSPGCRISRRSSPRPGRRSRRRVGGISRAPSSF